MGRRPHVHAQRTPAQAFVCRDARMHAHISHGLAAELQQSIAGLFCRQYELSCIAGTHVLQAHMHCSTPWADAMLLWICTQSCKSGAGMDTTLKWMLARARGQGVAPCTLSYICHTKVFSKVSNSLPIHQYFPTASPYGARSQADG